MCYRLDYPHSSFWDSQQSQRSVLRIRASWICFPKRLIYGLCRYRPVVAYLKFLYSVLSSFIPRDLSSLLNSFIVILLPPFCTVRVDLPLLTSVMLCIRSYKVAFARNFYFPSGVKSRLGN